MLAVCGHVGGKDYTHTARPSGRTAGCRVVSGLASAAAHAGRRGTRRTHDDGDPEDDDKHEARAAVVGSLAHKVGACSNEEDAESAHTRRACACACVNVWWWCEGGFGQGLDACATRKMEIVQ